MVFYLYLSLYVIHGHTKSGLVIYFDDIDAVNVLRAGGLMYKIILVKVDPSRATKMKKMKIADLVLLSLYMRDNEKCSISHTP